jgi:integrase
MARTERVTFAALRRTSATWARQQGLHPYLIEAMLRHESPSQTFDYSKVPLGDLQKAAAAMDNVLAFEKDRPARKRRRAS